MVAANLDSESRFPYTTVSEHHQLVKCHFSRHDGLSICFVGKEYDHFFQDTWRKVKKPESGILVELPSVERMREK